MTITPGDGLPSIGELNRNIMRLSQQLDETRRDLVQLHELRTRSELNRRAIEEHEERLDEVEDGLRWAVRLVLGALVLALIGLVLQAPELP